MPKSTSARHFDDTSPMASAEFGKRLADKMFEGSANVELHLDRKSIANMLEAAHEAGAKAAECRLGAEVARNKVTMQAAVIDSRGDAGPVAGMRWIVAALRSAGQMPDMEEVTKLGGARAWHEAKSSGQAGAA